MRFVRVWSRPAVSTRTMSRPRARAADTASNVTAAGSAPGWARITSTPTRSAHTASWIAAVLMRQGRVERPLLGVAARGVDLLPADAVQAGQARAVRIHAVTQGSAAERATLVAGDLLLRANLLPLFGVDDLKRALVLGQGRPITLDVQGKGGRRSFDVQPDPPRRAA